MQFRVDGVPFDEENAVRPFTLTYSGQTTRRERISLSDTITVAMQSVSYVSHFESIQLYVYMRLRVQRGFRPRYGYGSCCNSCRRGCCYYERENACMCLSAHLADNEELHC